MSDDEPAVPARDHRGPSGAARVAALLAAVLGVNLLVRAIGLPDVDLPEIPFPELPAWVHTVLTVKNRAQVGVVVLIVVLVALDQHERHGRSRRDGTGPGSG